LLAGDRGWPPSHERHSGPTGEPGATRSPVTLLDGPGDANVPLSEGPGHSTGELSEILSRDRCLETSTVSTPRRRVGRYLPDRSPLMNVEPFGVPTPVIVS